MGNCGELRLKLSSSGKAGDKTFQTKSLETSTSLSSSNINSQSQPLMKAVGVRMASFWTTGNRWEDFISKRSLRDLPFNRLQLVGVSWGQKMCGIVYLTELKKENPFQGFGQMRNKCFVCRAFRTYWNGCGFQRIHICNPQGFYTLQSRSNIVCNNYGLQMFLDMDVDVLSIRHQVLPFVSVLRTREQLFKFAARKSIAELSDELRFIDVLCHVAPQQQPAREVTLNLPSPKKFRVCDVRQISSHSN